MNHAAGQMVRGLIQTDDLTTAAPIALFDQTTGVAVPFTSPTPRRLIIYMVTISNGDTGCVITMFDDIDGDGVVDAGETIFKKEMTADDLAGFVYHRGFPLARLPKFVASDASGNTSITVFGEIQE